MRRPTSKKQKDRNTEYEETGHLPPPGVKKITPDDLHVAKEPAFVGKQETLTHSPSSPRRHNNNNLFFKNNLLLELVVFFLLFLFLMLLRWNAEVTSRLASDVAEVVLIFGKVVGRLGSVAFFFE